MATPMHDFLYTIGNWTPTNCTISINGSDEHVVTATASTTVYAIATITGLTDGEDYRFTAEGYADSANTTVNAARLALAAVATSPTGAYITSEDSWETLYINFTASGTTQTIYLQCASNTVWGTSGDVAKFRGLEIQQIVYGAPTGPNLISNSTFDSDTTGWSGFNASLAAVSGNLEVTKTGDWAGAKYTLSLTAGDAYILLVDKVNLTTNDYITVSQAANNSTGPRLWGAYSVSNSGMPIGSYEILFFATASNNVLWLATSIAAGGTDVKQWDNVECYPVDAIWESVDGPGDVQTDFDWESANFAFTGSDIDLVVSNVLKWETANFPFNGSEFYIQGTNSNYDLLALDYLWHEGNWPPYPYVPGTLPTEKYIPHWDGAPDPDSWELIPDTLTGQVIRNDHIPIDRRTNDAMLANAPLLYFFGCDVEPKEIVVPGTITEDYFVPITISNMHLGKEILVNNIFIVDDPFGTMTITPQNWPRYIPPYSFVTYTLKISATEGYPKFEATLVVDAGTCYTEIPITGSRDVDCPECPECPPPCPPEETEDMPSCMIEQELCAISRGDTVPFNFVFTTPTGAAMDISNMQLEFTLKLDVKQEIPDLINTVTFPATPDSIGGIGTMKITPAETLQLLAGAKYCFKFKLKNGVNDVYTVGLGWVSVNPDPPTAISE